MSIDLIVKELMLENSGCQKSSESLVWKMCLDTIEMMLKNNVDPNSQNNEGESILLIVAAS